MLVSFSISGIVKYPSFIFNHHALSTQSLSLNPLVPLHLSYITPSLQLHQFHGESTSAHEGIDSWRHFLKKVLKTSKMNFIAHFRLFYAPKLNFEGGN